MAVPELWAGVDAGKAHHHCVVINAAGDKVLSRRVPNNEIELLELIADVHALSADVLWAIDLNAGGGALLIALLVNHDQQLLYIPGRTIHHASGSYRGSGRSDAKDAFIIADQARMRRDLHSMTAGDEIAVDLRILTARRYDLAADRTRAINRLRAQILECFPALERAFDYSRSKAALVLLTGYQTPAALREAGPERLAAWLRERRVRNSDTVAATAITAARAQFTTVPGQAAAAAMTARLAKGVVDLDAEIAETDALIEGRVRQHRHATALLSMPGIGSLLGAEVLGLTGGDLAMFGSADRLAGVAGLAPVPRDSGRVQGTLRRPRRYNRRLLRAFYLSAQVAITRCSQSKAFYERRRREGKHHKQAVLALARRRLNVVWALVRDDRVFQAGTPQPAATAA
ncbi:IS110 family transposase [Kutzneria sp. 744]|uniref:IS110 family transposase n=1 Tax=Kutzneria sp. (strain 744) TaxID=345341 RepID=UPI0003EEA9A5|nr:IS110 family transposase [Kutzneria sp. 744]EWM11304.1 transposase [Kutzneria sp. 744]